MSKEWLTIWLLVPYVLRNFLFNFLTPLLLGDHNFLIFNAFLTIFNALDDQNIAFDFCLDTINKESLP
jgi:hypothetical protein